MLSLSATLQAIGGHVPPGFSKANGIKSLFPAKYAGSISVLSNYVYTRRAVTPVISGTDDCASYFVAADGAGRWFMSWTPRPYSFYSGLGAGGPLSTNLFQGSVADINIRLQGGFLFLYSDQGNAHGFIDTSRPGAGQLSCAQGTDPWIAEHWPELFAAEVSFGYQEAAGFDSLPSESDIWTGAGFGQNNFQPLAGANCPAVNTSTGSVIFREVYVSVAVRDGSLLNSYPTMTGAQFQTLWDNSQVSQSTIDNLSNLSKLWTVRYVSADRRTAIVSGSLASFPAIPSISLAVADATTLPPVTLRNFVSGSLKMAAGSVVVVLGGAAEEAGAPSFNGPLFAFGFGLAVTGGYIFMQGYNEFPFYQLLMNALSSSSPPNPFSNPSNAGPIPVSLLPDGSSMVGPLPPDANPQAMVSATSTAVSGPSPSSGGDGSDGTDSDGDPTS